MSQFGKYMLFRLLRLSCTHICVLTNATLTIMMSARIKIKAVHCVENRDMMKCLTVFINNTRYESFAALHHMYIMTKYGHTNVPCLTTQVSDALLEILKKFMEGD